MNWYRQHIEQVFELLGSSAKGLTTVQAQENRNQWGPNILPEKKKKTTISILFAQFGDVMILILLAAAVISGLIGDMTDTIVILIIVILNAVVGFAQEYRAEKAMMALKQLAITHAKVLRDGDFSWLPATELVPGDIVLLESGDAVPADLRMIEVVNLKIEEAALTGESQPAAKSIAPIDKENLLPGDRINMAFKGTFVAYGRGTGIVVATGMQTELGRIAQMLQESEPPTPLQQRLAVFGKKLSVMILLLCIIFFVAGWLRGEEMIKMALTSISLAVAAIPEALPAVITISLALAAKRMIRLHSLIRKLPAVETLGSVTYICTDKTGTLTKNKMHVDLVFVNNKRVEQKDFRSIILQEDGPLLFHAFGLNNDTHIDGNGDIKGDSTEIALHEISDQWIDDRTAWPRIKEIAFDAGRKLMTTFHDHDGTIISFTKGAPDMLLEKCKDIDKPALLSEVNKMADEGLRVLGFAYRVWPHLPGEITTGNSEDHLSFLGFAGLIDPPREEVWQAIEECKAAGIATVMITGDHPLTAKNIAERTGLLAHKNELVVTGDELAGFEEDEFLAKIEKIRVYARVSPEQKLQIIKALQQKGHFVAMTGDGVNDAPSLKRADIGIAMGITGTDVSKEAADMVLLDDNFSTIVRAIKEGRRVYDNILKFIKYLMTSNSGELWTLLLGPMIGLPVALLPIHILWINLVSDGLPAISLSFEKAEKDVMNRPPRPPRQNVFAEGRGLQILWIGMLMAGITLSMQGWAIRNHLHWQTIVFNILCLSQMGNVLAIRSEKTSLFRLGIFSNRLLIFAVVLAFILQAAITYIPSLQKIFHTEALSAAEFLIVGLASSMVFFAVEIEKTYRRNRSKSSPPVSYQ